MINSHQPHLFIHNKNTNQNDFKGFHPLEDKTFRIIDNEGKVINKALMPDLDNETIIKTYTAMLQARVADEMAVSYQRQGRMYTYPPILGQEALQIAAGMIIRENDWLAPAFREMGVMQAKGVTLKEIFHYMGNEEGSNFSKAHHVFPLAYLSGRSFYMLPALAILLNTSRRTKLCIPLSAMAALQKVISARRWIFAGVEGTCCFTIQNNQYAISVPVRNQTNSVNMAVKALSLWHAGH